MNRRRRTTGRAAVVSSLCGVLLVLPLLPARAATALTRVGTLPLAFGDGLVPDATTRRLIAIEGGRQPLSLSAYDGDSLRRVKHAAIAPAVWPQAGRGGRAMVYALDEPARRLYVIVYDSAETKDNTADPSMLSIDADSLRVVGRIDGVAPPGVRVLGMRLRPHGRAVLVLQTVAAAAPPLLFPVESPRVAGVLLEEIDLSGGARTWGPVAVRGCQSPITNQSQTTVAVDGRTAFVGCATSQVLSVAGPGVAAIASVDMDDPTAQRLSFLPGSYTTGDIAFDERARRLLPISSAANHPNQAVWVYDLAHRTLVGQVAAGEADIFGAAVEPASGRLYVSINNALLVTSDRGYEIAQALSFPVDANIGALTPIPFNRRVVVPVHGPHSTWVFAVYHDGVLDAAFSAGALPDATAFDSLTAHEAQFAAGAQAFGVRIHSIGGVNSLLQNVLPQGGNYWSQAGNLTGLKDGDRDVTLARVTRAHVSEGEASAEATAGDPDANTASDYLTLARRAPGIVPPEWPYEPHGCRDFGDGSPEQTSADASASCSLGKRSVTAAAAHGGAAIDGVLEVGSSSSSAALRLDDGGHLSGIVHAEARNVRFAAGPRIGEVISDATVTADGTRGGARASYRRTFRNVTAGDFRCEQTCDPTQVLAALTETLGSQARVEFPGGEALATPGGSHAHAVREPWEHQQDVVVNNQDPTQQQVAALRLTFVNDGTLASRVIVELAAAGADATKLRVVPPRPGAASPIPVVPPLPPLRIPRPDSGYHSPPLPSSAPAAVVEHVLGRGWRLLTAGDAGSVARGIALWALFAAPAFFASRRRVLIRMRTR